jgi:hypothetical protein
MQEMMNTQAVMALQRQALVQVPMAQPLDEPLAPVALSKDQLMASTPADGYAVYFISSNYELTKVRYGRFLQVSLCLAVVMHDKA